MMDTNKFLQYYKRREAQEAIVANAKDREVAVKYGEKGFGKRPDILQYPSDVLAMAKNGATSFHASEELWKNPLHLDPSLSRREIDSFRKGWDLIIDIDVPYWELSKLIAYVIMLSLKEHGIESLSIKFSGNKGFHIGVPFEVFPKKVSGYKTELLFPDAPRKIAQYLLYYISQNLIEVKEDKIIFAGRYGLPLSKIQSKMKVELKDMIKYTCQNCRKKVKKEMSRKIVFLCPKCNSSITDETKEFMQCPKCNVLMVRDEITENSSCCDNPNHISYFDPLSIIEIDTILISSRHMYRMPYSLHEKSGLASIVFDPEKTIAFSKQLAVPEKLTFSKHIFLNRKSVRQGEGRQLIEKALAFQTEEDSRQKPAERKQFEEITEAIPEEYFPPCIHNLLAGLEDGRKRAVFILTNFLTNLGWNYQQVEELIQEWNTKNYDELREVYYKGQMRYHKNLKKKIPPPNCDNKSYYIDMRICTPDNLCKNIKNPLMYTLRKYGATQKKKKGRQKLTPEQKEMRKRYREMKKKKQT